jgi:hypothetical protein
VDILTRVEQWKSTGGISTAQYDAISALIRRNRFSLFLELTAALYLGVLAVAAGVGWTMTAYSARLGDAAIVASLTVLCGWSLRYTFARALPYSHGEVEQQAFAVDYVLYLGCLVFALDLGYVQSRFQPFQIGWDQSLLIGAAVFFGLAYRFDNRLVLSLALSSLAAWCGVRAFGFGFLFRTSLRATALAYGMGVAAAGMALHRAGIKRHFLDTYLHVGANVVFVALLSGVAGSDESKAYLLALLLLAGFTVVVGARFRRFSFVVYGVISGYLGISIRVFDHVSSFASILAYFVVTGTIVVAALVLLARSLGRES